jgi:hypothetical protein
LAPKEDRGVVGFSSFDVSPQKSLTERSVGFCLRKLLVNKLLPEIPRIDAYIYCLQPSNINRFSSFSISLAYDSEFLSFRSIRPKMIRGGIQDKARAVKAEEAQATWVGRCGKRMGSAQQSQWVSQPASQPASSLAYHPQHPTTAVICISCFGGDSEGKTYHNNTTTEKHMIVSAD